MNPLLTTGLDAHRGTTALSVNVNKVALLRNTRALELPSVLRAATLALEAGVTAARAEEDALSGEALVGLQAALEHGSLPALQQACRPGLAALKTRLRSVIQHHLGSATLRTRRVMMELQGL